MYGNPEVTTGGNALKYYASVRIDIRRGESIKNGSEIIGSHTRAKVVKNKVAPPYREAEFDIMYGVGINRLGELLDLAAKYEIIQKGGAWFSYGETRLGQGRENARNFLKSHPELANEIEQKLMEKLKTVKMEISEKAEKSEEQETSRSAVEINEPASAPVKTKNARPSVAKTNIDISVDD